MHALNKCCQFQMTMSSFNGENGVTLVFFYSDLIRVLKIKKIILAPKTSQKWCRPKSKTKSIVPDKYGKIRILREFWDTPLVLWYI